MRSAFELTRRTVGASLALCLMMASSIGRAHAETIEPTYGRVDGDLNLVAGVGGVLAARGPRASAEFRVRYLESAGLFVTYENALGSEAEPRDLGAAGFEVRPVFLLRWLEGLETRRARLDLMLDSVGLEVGATLSESSAHGFASNPGIEVGLGFEIPVEAAATGVWVGVHGGIRWGADALGFEEVRDADDRAAYLAVTVTWHQAIEAHVVDIGDRAP